MPPDRFCVACSHKLSVEKRVDATFCGPRCRVAWHRAREQVRQDSALLAQLETQLNRYASEGACFYRLLLGDGAAVFAYPAQAKASRRFDDRRRRTPGFRLAPYEPPMVPRQGRYEVILLDASGALLPTPSELIAVYAEPTRKPVGLETGERLR